MIAFFIKRLIRGFTLLLILFWIIFALGPYIWMFLTSVKPSNELYTRPVQYLPHPWTFAAYGDLFGFTAFPQFMEHSVLVALGTVICTLLLAIPAGYSLSRHHFRGKSVILALLVSSQFFPSILLVLALFPLMRTFGLLNQLYGLVVVYTAFVAPFATWLVKGFFDALPRELDEAARVDGCSEVQAIIHILLPGLAPGVVAASAYIIIFSWNEFLFALTFASAPQSMTLPVGLSTFIGNFVTRWDVLTAGGVVAALPILAFFYIAQRRLVSGLAAGAVKS